MWEQTMDSRATDRYSVHDSLYWAGPRSRFINQWRGSHFMVKLETWKSRTWLLVDYWGLETVLSFQASRQIRL